MQDSLNQGLPSDRFNVDWWITTDYVAQHIAGQVAEPELSSDTPILNPATLQAQSILVPPEHCSQPNGELCLVEIPVDIAVLKQAAPDVALQWRLQTRELFETAFDMGYMAVDLIRRDGRNYYLLQENWQSDQ